MDPVAALAMRTDRVDEQFENSKALKIGLRIGVAQAVRCDSTIGLTSGAD
jgi:hypothetical protein